MSLPSVMVAPFIVANTEFLLTLPRRVARGLGTAVDLTRHEALFDTPDYTPNAVTTCTKPVRMRAGGCVRRLLKGRLVLLCHIISCAVYCRTGRVPALHEP